MATPRNGRCTASSVTASSRSGSPDPITFDTLREALTGDFRFEGIVWHHPDGRMAKLKRRDFEAVSHAT